VIDTDAVDDVEVPEVNVFELPTLPDTPVNTRTSNRQFDVVPALLNVAVTVIGPGALAK
jgi:hypothetical protein